MYKENDYKTDEHAKYVAELRNRDRKYTIGSKPIIPNTTINPEYSNAVARQQEYFNSQRTFAQNAYADLLAQLQNSYNQTKSEVDKSADKALQVSYINKSLTERDLPQTMSAAGLTGGASESTLLGLKNNYLKNRTITDEQRAKSIGKLLQQYNSAKQQAYSSLQNQLNSFDTQNFGRLNSIENSFSNGTKYSVNAENITAAAYVGKQLANGSSIDTIKASLNRIYGFNAAEANVVLGFYGR